MSGNSSTGRQPSIDGGGRIPTPQAPAAPHPGTLFHPSNFDNRQWEINQMRIDLKQRKEMFEGFMSFQTFATVHRYVESTYRFFRRLRRRKSNSNQSRAQPSTLWPPELSLDVVQRLCDFGRSHSVGVLERRRPAPPWPEPLEPLAIWAWTSLRNDHDLPKAYDCFNRMTDDQFRKYTKDKWYKFWLMQFVRMIPVALEAVEEAGRVLDLTPASTSAIEGLRIGVIEAGKEVICGICQYHLSTGDAAIVLDCNNSHAFHEDCIKPWLRWQNSCPCCRKPIPEST